jgi:hypothetical protein
MEGERKNDLPWWPDIVSAVSMLLLQSPIAGLDREDGILYQILIAASSNLRQIDVYKSRYNSRGLR